MMVSVDLFSYFFVFVLALLLLYVSEDYTCPLSASYSSEIPIWAAASFFLRP